MIWTTDLIQRLLDLYLEQHLLWDTNHNLHTDISARDKALQFIADNLGVPNVTVEDIARKYRSMRAAYRVELRKIYAAKLRGFFYKPSLHWFSIFKQFMKDLESVQIKQVPTKLLRQCGYSGKDVNLNEEGDLLAIDPLDLEIDLNVELSGEECSSEDSSDECDDEFQSFADHIAEQLRSLSVHRAVMIQNQIQRIFANDREIHDGYNEEEQEEMMMM